MKLNMDCVRDILLCVEEYTDLRKVCRFVDTDYNKPFKSADVQTVSPEPYQVDLQADYEMDVLIYHVRYCLQVGLIVGMDPSESGANIYVVSDLTPKGHEFLENIRNEEAWTKTKEFGQKIGAFSLSMAEKIAEGVATAFFNKLI